MPYVGRITAYRVVRLVFTSGLPPGLPGGLLRGIHLLLARQPRDQGRQVEREGATPFTCTCTPRAPGRQTVLGVDVLLQV